MTPRQAAADTVRHVGSEGRLPHPLPADAVEDLVAHLIAETWKLSARWDEVRSRPGYNSRLRFTTIAIRLHRRRAIAQKRLT